MKKEEIIQQIAQLEKQLDKITKQEKTIDFLELLSSVLVNDLCTITLTGHNEWQFQKTYKTKEITFEQRNKISRSIREIIKELKEVE